MPDLMWIKALDKLLVWLALIMGGVMLAFMTLFGTWNVLVMRKVMNAPVRGAEDLMILSLVILVAIAIPFGGRCGAHIEIEVMESRMSPGFARWSMLGLRLVAGALMLLMSYELVKAGGKATKFGETTQQLLISYEPFYYLLAICVAVYALVLASDAIQLLLCGKIRQIALGADL
ncbi:TRAP transporter small permease [Roseibium album]|uniref:TRAP transporter small permease protein n=1 Tax=Roseibium album TaxID=311410 RepID=A0A0M6ZFV9_9HYPH|nr:TRAP transporter small permease subunit [Roseibium album]CTQ60303.1 TRAP-type C4-dicarboxylate transport system, small permease component [Roseibium album]CTQ66581.1 TRAP-type C4-dicarboxylate transport system, small permease component [Roseibium album]CTQ74400.1 TRAP-type C4-dicarboxylate transport system, small permease component [Roseibium album]